MAPSGNRSDSYEKRLDEIAQQVKSQHERFIDAARQLKANESDQQFDAALKRVAKAKLTHPPRIKEVKDKKKNE